jgi:hypothetical protein
MKDNMKEGSIWEREDDATIPPNIKEETLIDPTEEDLERPVFEAIWQAIKKWDIERDYGLGRAGATGTDVKTILIAIEPFLKNK